MNEPEWLVTCARCERIIKGEHSRLFWHPKFGTYRICGYNLSKKCERLTNEKARSNQSTSEEGATES